MKHTRARPPFPLLLLGLRSAVGFAPPMLIGTSPQQLVAPGRTATTNLYSTLALKDGIFPTETANPFPSFHRAGSRKRPATSQRTLATSRDDTKTKATTLVEFPPPLNKAGRFKRAATFWLSTAPIVADYMGFMGRMKMEEIHNGIGKKVDKDIETTWEAQHEAGAQKLYETIAELNGFYVKAAQIIATRGDLFPRPYIDKLKEFSDNVDPMDVAMVRAIITQELLHKGETFEDVFVEFDEEPLGAASIAQVHRAVLSAKYGGREVAIKVQRPSIESKLMGDIQNLKLLAKIAKDADLSPVDYYTIFSELEVQLANEFDFLQESQAMDAIYQSLATSMDGTTQTEIPVVIPRPISGLMSSRVLVMDYLKGTPLTRAQEKMKQAGVQPGSPQSKLMGRKLISALTAVFGRNILETGLFHADPHPGNIFVLDDGEIGLIDFGQVKELSTTYRETIAKIILALEDNHNDKMDPACLEEMKAHMSDLGVEFKTDARPEAAVAFALWLFDGSVEQLPGGYDTNELSPNAPIKDIAVFPQDLVLVARSSILIKAFSKRFGVPNWSLAKQWAPVAREVLCGTPSVQVKRSSRLGRLGRSWMSIKNSGRSVGRRILQTVPLSLSVKARVASLFL